MKEHSYEELKEEEDEPILLHFGKDGKLEMFDYVTIEKKSFQRLKKGMAFLKKKYPKIAKECFS